MLATSKDIVCDNVVVSLHSAHRENPTTTYPQNAKFILSPPIQRVSSVSVLGVQVPFAYTAISQTGVGSLLFRFNAGGSERWVNIPAGNYTSATICDVLKTGMDAYPGAPYTVTYSSTTMKITISSASDFQVLTDPKARDIVRLLGFHEDSAVSTSVTGDHPINLAGPLYLNLGCEEIGRYQGEQYRNSGYNIDDGYYIIYTLPVNVGPTGIITSSLANPVPIKFVNKHTISTLQFYWWDDLRQSIQFPLDWSIQLLFQTS